MSHFNTDDAYGILSMPAFNVYGSFPTYSVGSGFSFYGGGQQPGQTYLAGGNNSTTSIFDFSNLDDIIDNILDDYFKPEQAKSVELNFSNLQSSLDTGDLAGFWDTLKTEFPASEYIEIAYNFVTRANSMEVRFSLEHAVDKYNATEEQLNQISADLAQRYLDYLQTHLRLPNEDVIADMHNQAFTDAGLPEEAWYANTIPGSLGYSLIVDEPVDVDIINITPPPPVPAIDGGGFYLNFDFDFDFDFTFDLDFNFTVPSIPGIL